MDFTPEERTLIAYLARQQGSPHEWGFYLAILVPILAFAGYGVLRQDVIALGIAFLALLGLLAWYMRAGGQSSALLASICRKLEQAPAMTEGGGEQSWNS